MSKLRNFFGSKSTAPVVVEDKKDDVALDSELYLTIARQFGKESETIRTLLLDAEQKIKELEDIKHAIGEQVDPMSKTLHKLEETKISLGAAEERIATLESEAVTLQDTLATTQHKLSSTESAHAAQAKELAGCRTQIADLKGRVAQQSADIQAAREEIRRLTERANASDKQKAQLEKDLAATRQTLEVTQQKLTTSENDRLAVKKSAEQASADLSQMSQRLLEADKVIEEAKQKYESDIALHEMNYEALKTRADLTHQLLEETRKGMLERAQAIQSSIAA